MALRQSIPSATLIEFNQDIIQNRQSRGISVRKQELKFYDKEKNVSTEHV